MAHWRDVPAGRVDAAVRRFLDGLGDNADTIFDRLIEDYGYPERLGRYARNDGFEPSVSQKRAIGIMGAGNVFGVDGSIKCLKVCPTRRQLGDLVNVPFAESVLEECRDTHVLTAVFPLSVVDIRDKTRYGLFCRDDWRQVSACTQRWPDKSAYWCLVRKTPVPDSGNRTFEDQERLLAPDDLVSPTRDLVYAIIGRYLLAEEYLFGDVEVRCDDIDACGSHATVSPFSVSRGINVRHRPNGEPAPNLHLASTKRPTVLMPQR